PVFRVVEFPPPTILRPPATGDDIGAVLGSPNECISLALRTQARVQADWHELSSRCHARRPQDAIPGGNARACSAVVVAVIRPGASQVLWARIAGQQRRITRGNYFAITSELGVIDVDAIVDDGNRDTLSARNLVCRLHIGVRVDSYSADCGLL